MTRRKLRNTAAAFVATLTIGIAAQSVAPTDAHALRRAQQELKIDPPKIDAPLQELQTPPPPPRAT